jgi:N utilization substance protein B
MASRRKSRILAFQALYSWEAHNAQTKKTCIESLVNFEWIEEEKVQNMKPESIAFTQNLILGTIEQIQSIDKLIKQYIQNWDFSRLKKVDLAILRISIYSMMYQKDIHSSIVISEAIEIAREYGTDDSFKFINAVLDSIRKLINPSEIPTKKKSNGKN